MIDHDTVERIIQAAHIEDVVSDYVSLRKRGVNYIGLCPFHDEKTPSFTVSPAKGICKCFGCGKGGNSVNFIMEVEQISYVEALRHLAKKYNIEIIEKELTPEEQARKTVRESLMAINEYARNYFTNILVNHAEGKSIGMSYFRERGFTDVTIKEYQLGYSLDVRDAFSQEAIRHGFKKDLLLKTGLTIDGEHGMADRFRGRVIFPVLSLSGKVVAFGGRVLKKTDKTAKYLNSPESEIYHKSNELYGIYQAKQFIVKNDRCYLVEGYTDVISMHQSGVLNVVASSGTSLTTGQIRLIHRFTNNVTVLYDGDAAGIHASLRGIDMLLQDGLNIKVVLLPDGEDPDSYARTHNAVDFIEYLDTHSVDFIKFKTDLLLKDAGDDPIKKAGLIADIVRSISVIPDSITRSVYVKECSTQMQIDESILYNEVLKIKRDKFMPPSSAVKPPEHRLPVMSVSETVSSPDRTEAEFNPYHQQETDLMRYVVKYGERGEFFCKNRNGEELKLNVAQFIDMELTSDGLTFNESVDKKMFDEVLTKCGTSDFKAESFFLQHPDPLISKHAVELATDKYKHIFNSEQIKKLEEEECKLLQKNVINAVYELKNKIVLDKIKKAMLNMKTAAESHDADEVNRLMEEIDQLNKYKSAFSKELGDRIIIKL